MKMPPEARVVFDDLLVRPLENTRLLKRHFAARAAQLIEEAEETRRPRLRAILETTQALLDTIERKTSPLYVRLIHALAEYLMLDASAHPVSGEELIELQVGVVNSVAHSTRRFQHKFE